MSKPYLSINWLLAAPLATLFGVSALECAYAQSSTTDENPLPTSYLVPGGGLGSGILPHNSLGPYFSGRTIYGFQIHPTANDSTDTDNTAQVWLELDGHTTATNGVSAQVGLGYSPSPGLGFSVGPFVDLNGPIARNIGVYEAGSDGYQPRSTRLLLSKGGNRLDDAGLAASLSFMPLEDIWIGLHGSVSHSLTPSESPQGMLDGIDAMLGLTARYRIEF